MLTENEWKLLKEVYTNVFSVNVDQSDDMRGVLMSVLVNDHQVFGGGATVKEAKDATALAAFEYIEETGLEVGVDVIEISNRVVEEDDSDQETFDVSCIQKLKDFQNSLQQRNLCLDKVPCSDIFETIGISFKFEYDFGEGTDNPALARVKEMTSRFAVKKLLDLAYDLDD